MNIPDELMALSTEELLRTYRSIATKRGTEFADSLAELELCLAEARRRDALGPELGTQLPRPDWSEAPANAMWWCVDAVGTEEWHEVEPIVVQSVWLWPPSGNMELPPMHWTGGRIEIPLGIDWRLLKERRPDPAP